MLQTNMMKNNISFLMKFKTVINEIKFKFS